MHKRNEGVLGEKVPMSFSDKGYSYHEKREFRYKLQDYMHEVFQFHSYAGQLILDLGSGAGIDSAEFAKGGAEVVSLDLTESSTELTKNTLREAGVYERGHVIQAVGQKLPFRDGAFDCVYSFGVLHHIPDVKAVLSEIRRVLRPGGKIMAMLYHRDSLLYAYSIIYLHGIKEGLLSRYSPEEILARFSERIEGCPYTKAYSKEEAYNLFKEYFKELEISVHYDVIDTEQERKLKLKIPRGYDLGWHLIIKGVKH
jgi:ubiquinone/menaquinone biosynthesis C-methylase UbiE